MSNPTQQGFPAVGTSFTDPATGRIQQAWLQLLIQLWNRTGSASGASTTVVINDLTLVSAELAALSARSTTDPSSAALSLLSGEVEGLGILGAQRAFLTPGSLDDPPQPYRPLTTGAEPMVFVSDGAGVPIMVAFAP